MDDMEPADQQVKTVPVAPPLKKAGFGHYLALFYELCLLVVVLSVGAFAVLLWRLQTAPLSADNIREPLQNILAVMAGASDVQIEKPVLGYNQKEHILNLSVTSLQMYPKTAPTVAMRQVNLQISLVDLLFGHVFFPQVSVAEMGLRLDVSRDMGIALSTDATTKTQATQTDLGWVASLLSRVGDLNLQNVTLTVQNPKSTRVFRNIKLMGTGEKFKNAGTLALRFAENVDTLGNSDSLGLAYAFNDATDQLHVALALPSANPKFLADGAGNVPLIDTNLSGQAALNFGRDGQLKGFDLDFNGDAGNFAWPSFGITDKPIRRIIMQAAYDAGAGILEFKNIGFMLRGVELFLNGQLTATPETPHQLQGVVTLTSPVVALPMIQSLWPSNMQGPAHEWLVKRLQGGRLAGIAAKIPLIVQRDEAKGVQITTNENDITAQFRFADVAVDYHDYLGDLAGTSGTGTFKNKALDLQVSAGHVGALKLRKGSLLIDDIITAGKGTATLDVMVQGPVAALVKYLSVEPVNLHQRTENIVQQSTGTGIYNAKVVFPITKDAKLEDVKVQAGAVLRNMRIPKIVKDMDATGGPYIFKLQDETVTLTGDGQIGGQPLNVTLWQSIAARHNPNADSMKVSARVTSNDAGRALLLGRVAKQISGQAPVKIVYSSHMNGKGVLSVDADLNNAAIDFAPLNAKKAAGSNGKLSLKGNLQDGILKDLTDINVNAPAINVARGRIGFAPDGTITAANFANLRAGDTVGNLNYALTNGTESIRFSGATFDARRARQEQGVASGVATDTHITAGRLWLSAVPLNDASMTLQKSSQDTLQMMDIKGAVQGNPVRVSFTPNNGLQIESPDAGLALTALGVTDRIKGGMLDVNLRPSKDGSYTGNLNIKNFSVARAPALAKLINLLSIPGLLNILNNDTGLSFTKLESKMIWFNRMGGGLYQFRDGRTGGSSLGLTFEGEVNAASNQIAIQGTAVPMSEVNSLLGNIPIIGDLLTGGGSGKGVFAATYSMSGAASDPQVMVNPLSVLAPGLLRRLLFEGVAPPKTKTVAKPVPKP